jgi:hypothetical protein
MIPQPPRGRCRPRCSIALLGVRLPSFAVSVDQEGREAGGSDRTCGVNHNERWGHTGNEQKCLCIYIYIMYIFCVYIYYVYMYVYIMYIYMCVSTCEKRVIRLQDVVSTCKYSQKWEMKRIRSTQWYSHGLNDRCRAKTESKMNKRKIVSIYTI